MKNILLLCVAAVFAACAVPLTSLNSGKSFSLSIRYSPISASGNPQGARLLLPDATYGTVTLTGSSGTSYTASQTLSSNTGTFSFAAVLPGTYSVMAEASSGPAAATPLYSGVASLSVDSSMSPASITLLPFSPAAMVAGANAYGTLAANTSLSFVYSLASVSNKISLTGLPSKASYYLQNSAGNTVSDSSGLIAGGGTDGKLYLTLYNAGPSPVTAGNFGLVEGLVGSVSTFAGSATYGLVNGSLTGAQFHNPWGIVVLGSVLYVTDYSNNCIRKIDTVGNTVTVFAGSLSGVSGYANGVGTSALFYNPSGICTDGTNLYVTDTSNNCIRQINLATANVTLLAGTPTSGGTANATVGTSASFYLPQGICTDGTNLYVADTPNDMIRKIVIATTQVSTLAGTAFVAGYVDAPGTAAQFYGPNGICTDGTNLYVSDAANNRIRKVVISSGVVSTFAGSGAASTLNGIGLSAQIANPGGIVTDGTSLYVVEHANDNIRKIDLGTLAVTTIAGSSSSGFVNGTGTAASFAQPVGIATDGTNFYVADYSNNVIRLIQ